MRDAAMSRAATSLLASHEPFGALYIHIPFCKKRCSYCDFSTEAHARDDAAVRTYVERLVVELFRASRAGELSQVETVYIGGGTPTHLGLSNLSSLLYALSLSMNLSPDRCEVTMEANPESLTDRIVCDAWAMGVNRLSIGVQSFDDEVLALLGRAHDAEAARCAIGAARLRFDNVSCDLMCGIPGQGEESLRRSVEAAIEAGVAHVSVYPLSVEEGTPLARAIEAGEVPDPDGDTQADHMRAAEELLVAAGFHRYEVASYAKPGFECRHNRAYWTGVPYLGLGTSAVSMLQNEGERIRVRDGAVEERISAREALVEDVMLGMRMSRGPSEALVSRAIGAFPHLRDELESLAAQGYVERADGRWRPTDAGWLCGNDLYGRILGCAQAPDGPAGPAEAK